MKVKSVLNDLSPKKRQLLVELYDMPHYAVLKEVIELLQGNQALNVLTASNMEEVKYLSGQAYGLKLLHQNLKELHDKMEKD